MDISLRTEAWTVEDRSWLGSQDGTQYTESITLDTSAFTANTHYPNGYVPSGTVLAKLDSGLYGPYSPSTNEIQQIAITGAPTGGTFTLTWDGQTTAAIAYNATAADVQTALEALSNIDAGDVVAAGGALPATPVTVTFQGQYAGSNVAAMTADDAGLTGGSTPEVAITTSTAGGTDTGSGGTEVAAGFLFNSTEMRQGGPDVGAPLLWRGVIRESRLPANSGLDVAAKADLAAKFRFKA